MLHCHPSISAPLNCTAPLLFCSLPPRRSGQRRRRRLRRVQVAYGAGPLIQLLLGSGAHHYLEFKLVQGRCAGWGGQDPRCELGGGLIDLEGSTSSADRPAACPRRALWLQLPARLGCRRQ